MSTGSEVARGRRATPNKSLRSFLPLEVAQHILAHLDQRSLARLCLVSFASLQEAGPLLMKHVEIFSCDALYHFLNQCLIPPTSRLRTSLHLPTFLRTLSIFIPSSNHQRIRLTNLLPPFPRLPLLPNNSALPLRRLTIFYPPRNLLPFLFHHVLSRFDPASLEMVSPTGMCRREAPFPSPTAPPPASTLASVGNRRLLSPQISPQTLLANWESLKKVVFQGWIPLGSVPIGQETRRDVPPFFLRFLPPSPARPALDIVVDTRKWEVEELRFVPSALACSGALGAEMAGGTKRLRWVVKEEEQEKEARGWLKGLKKEERERIWLVVVA